MQIATHDITDPQGFKATQFELTTKDGRLISGALWLPESLDQGTVVCFGHGASGDRFQWPIPVLGDRMRCEAGVIGISLDGPRHGLRRPDEGHPREHFIQGLVQGDIIDEMVSDWEIALPALSEHFSFEAKKVGYFGLSMGTMLGLSFLQRVANLSAAVLGLAGTSDQFPGADRMRASAQALTAPILYLMNLSDEFFSREMYLDLYEHIGSKDKRIHANPGSHDYLAIDELESIYQFLLHHLKEGDPRHFQSIVDGSKISN